MVPFNQNKGAVIERIFIMQLSQIISHRVCYQFIYIEEKY